jgi:hypothetical protein
MDPGARGGQPAALGGAAQAAAPPAPPPMRPSVVILAEDEDLASHRSTPKTKALLEDQDAAFTNYFAS